MEIETSHDLKNNVMKKERTDTPNSFRVGVLLKKFRLALLLTASLANGCVASYKTVRSYSGFEPIIGQELTTKIPGELVINVSIEGEHLDISVKKHVTVKQINRMTEREIQYEERETEKLEKQLYTAVGFGAIGLGALGLATQNSGDEREQANTAGGISISIGGLIALHGAYIAYRGMDSKKATGETRVIDRPISENDVLTSGSRLVNLRIGGDQSFPLGETDDAGHLRLTLEQLVQIIPQEQLAELLDSGEKVFVEIEGTLSIAVDLKEMLSAEERITYEEYKKLDNGRGKIEAGSLFLQKYPKSLFATKVRKQVDKLTEDERMHTAACVEWFKSNTGYEPGTYDLSSCIEATPILVERFRARHKCQETVDSANGTLGSYEERMSNLNVNLLQNAMKVIREHGIGADQFYQTIFTNEEIDAAVARVVEACGGLEEETGIRLSTEVSERGKNVKIKMKRTNVAIERFNREIARYCAKKVCIKEECRGTESYKRTKYNLKLRDVGGYYWLQDRDGCWDSEHRGWGHPEVVECTPFQSTDSRCAALRCVEWGTLCLTKP